VLGFLMSAQQRSLIDHGSRAALCLQTLVVRNSWTILGYLCLSIGRYGKPRSIRTDNEAIFNSFVFRTFLKLAGIRKQTIPTCSPWCNGRIERFFGTLKPVLKQFSPFDRHDLQTALQEFILFYNHCRPHQNLENRTPAEVWNKQSENRLSGKKDFISVQALRGALTGFQVRRR
jgi:putative transposase